MNFSFTLRVTLSPHVILRTDGRAAKARSDDDGTESERARSSPLSRRPSTSTDGRRRSTNGEKRVRYPRSAVMWEPFGHITLHTPHLQRFKVIEKGLLEPRIPGQSQREVFINGQAHAPMWFQIVSR